MRGGNCKEVWRRGFDFGFGFDLVRDGEDDRIGEMRKREIREKK